MARSMRSISLALRTTDFVRNHVMLVVAAALAFFTMIIVPPDGAYLGYFDWNTLGCLFSVLAVANAFRFAGVRSHCAHRDRTIEHADHRGYDLGRYNWGVLDGGH